MSSSNNNKTSVFSHPHIDRSKWKRVRLGDVLQVCHGKCQHSVESKTGKYPILATSGEIGRTDQFLYNKPSVLIGRKGTIDKPQYIDTPFWTIDTLFYTKVADGYSPKFMFYLCQMIDWVALNEASGVPSLSANRIESLEVCVPQDLGEQLRIVKSLDAVESHINTLQALISKYEAIKKATVKLLLKPKDERQTSPIGDLYSVSSGLSKGASYFGKGYPFVSFSTIFNNPILPVIVDELVESTPKERQQYSVCYGDIFLTRTSETLDELGMSSVALRDIPHATFNGFSKRLRPKSEDLPICPEFAAYYLRSNYFRDSIIRLSAMTTRASLSGELIRRLPIQYPPLPEQRKIAARILAIDNVLKDCHAQLAKAQNLKQGMMSYFFG